MTDGPTLRVRDDAGRTFVSMDAAGRVTGHSGHVDLGQGIEVALAQIVAEELNLPLADVGMILGDTARTPDQGPTIASESIQVSAIPLRLAAATLHADLVRRAALRLNAPSGEVRLIGGRAEHGEASVLIGALIPPEGADIAIDPDARLKDPAAYTVVGQRSDRRDLPDKVTGGHTFIHDVSVPGMLHGHVVRPPYAGRDSGDFVGRSLLGYDEEAIAGCEGFVAVVRAGDLLGVVATHADLARALAEALPVNWRIPPPLPDMETLADTIRDQPSTPRVLDISGDIDTGLLSCDAAFKRSYVWPYQLHGSIGPSCAVADWANGVPVVWCGSQNPHMLRGDLAELTDLPPEAVDVRRYQAAGCYGRNCADDVAGDALILSRAVGRPVRVQLTRAQENLWEPKGSAQIMDVEGGVRDGALHAYRLDTWYPSNRGPNLALLLTGRIGNEPRPVEMGDRTVIPPYRVPNRRITVHDLAPVVRASWFRGVSALPNTFAHECFMDEMAAECGRDPVAFRLDHVDDPRVANLIRRTAEAGGWDARSGSRARREGRMAYGQGFAYATYVHGTFPGVAAAAAAWVCDVAVDTVTGEITLTRVLVGQDQGLVINPDGVRQQIRGNVHQTAGRVLSEEVTFDAIVPTQRSWADYPITTFETAPEIGTLLIERPGDPPLGVGESAAVPAAAAIANAIFDATGIRLREAPFTAERMRGELRNAGFDAPEAIAPHPRKLGRLRNRMFAGLAVLGGALTIGAVATPLHRAIPRTAPPAATSFSKAFLDQGRQLFAAGNCASCHTAEGGIANAGGRPVPTPFGTIWTSNITPDPDTGLGAWSFEAFERAMRHGISRDGLNLYPAFPYDSFAGMTQGDLFALHAYLQTLDPVRQKTPVARLAFPANIRAANVAWNALYHDASPLEPNITQSETWNRGRYLVETVGHCAACHSPRNALGARRKGDAHLTGAMVNGWYAPPLAGDAAAMRGWDVVSLSAYLQTGHAANIASAAGPMAEVVANTMTLPEGDLIAMATYLTELAGDTSPAADVPQASMPGSPAHRLFETACASCHEPAMEGMLTSARVSLSKSMAVRAPVPDAAITVISEGLRAPDGTVLRDMPAYAGELSGDRIEDLARYVRRRYAPDLPEWPLP